MADKVYVLEVGEDRVPAAAPTIMENELLAMWIAELLGDALGVLSLDPAYEKAYGVRAPEGQRWDNLVMLGDVAARALDMEPRLEEAISRVDALEEAMSRIDSLEARLAALEGEPPA